MKLILKTDFILMILFILNKTVDTVDNTNGTVQMTNCEKLTCIRVASYGIEETMNFQQVVNLTDSCQ